MPDGSEIPLDEAMEQVDELIDSLKNLIKSLIVDAIPKEDCVHLKDCCKTVQVCFIEGLTAIMFHTLSETISEEEELRTIFKDKDCQRILKMAIRCEIKEHIKESNKTDKEKEEDQEWQIKD